MKRQLNVVANTESNIGGNIGSNICNEYSSNIIWLVDTVVYIGGKCIVDIVLIYMLVWW